MLNMKIRRSQCQSSGDAANCRAGPNLLILGAYKSCLVFLVSPAILHRGQKPIYAQRRILTNSADHRGENVRTRIRRGRPVSLRGRPVQKDRILEHDGHAQAVYATILNYGRQKTMWPGIVVSSFRVHAP